jgi:hypothetical protein
MKGALVAPTCDTLLNYNFCQSNNQFEEAATHDLKSEHPQPHTEGLLSVNSAALLAAVAYLGADVLKTFVSVNGGVTQVAILRDIDERAGDFLLGTKAHVLGSHRQRTSSFCVR